MSNNPNLKKDKILKKSLKKLSKKKKKEKTLLTNYKIKIKN